MVDPAINQLITDAEARARRDERISARLDSHDTAINELRGSSLHTATALEDLKVQVGRVERALDTAAAAANAVADAAREAAGRSVSSRQLMVALVTVAIALLALVSGGGHL